MAGQRGHAILAEYGNRGLALTGPFFEVAFTTTWKPHYAMTHLETNKEGGQVSGSEGGKDSGKRSLSRMQQETEGPAQAFRITFLPSGQVVEAGPVDPEGHHEGLPGSVLDFAYMAGIDIDHACGGFAACSTCHVIVREGLETCNEISEDEDEMLDEAPGLTLKSRLACQCIADGSQNLVVEIPTWNRNLAREDH